MLWFNWRIAEDGTIHNQEIESSASSQSAFASGINSSSYVGGGGLGNLPLLKPIGPPGYVTASAHVQPARSTLNVMALLLLAPFALVGLALRRTRRAKPRG